MKIYDPSKPPKEAYDGRSETLVNHFYEKLLRIRDTLHTKTAKELAGKRHKLMEDFIKSLVEEWNKFRL
jgi:uncharacterized protein